MTGDPSTYVAVCRGFGLDEHEIRGDSTTNAPVESVFETGTDEERHARLLDRLAGSRRGVDLPAAASDEELATELRVALAAAGRGDAAEALGDGGSNVLDRLAAVEQTILGGEHRVVRLSSDAGDDEWRFFVCEGRRLAGVREQFGPTVTVDGGPVLHADQPADRSVDPSDHLTGDVLSSGGPVPSPGGRPKRIVSDTSVDDILASVSGDGDGDESDAEPRALEGGTVDRALEAPPSEPAGPALDEPPIEAPGEVDEEPIVARGRVEEDPIVAPGTIDAAANADTETAPSALDEPEPRPALDEPPSEPAGPALDEPPIVAQGEVDEDPIVARGTVEEDPVVAPGTVEESADATDSDDEDPSEQS